MPPLAASLLVLSVDVTLTNDKAALDFTIEEIEKLFPVNLGLSCLCIWFWSWRGLTGMDQLRRAFYAARRDAPAGIHQSGYQGGDRLYDFYGLLPHYLGE